MGTIFCLISRLRLRSFFSNVNSASFHVTPLWSTKVMFSDTWIGREFFLLTCTHTHVLLRLNKAALENSFSNISRTAYCNPVDLKKVFSMQHQERIYQNRLPPPAFSKLPKKVVLKLTKSGLLKLVNNWCCISIIESFLIFPVKNVEEHFVKLSRHLLLFE